MADRIAGLLFDSATLLMPTLIVASLLGIYFLVRHWPRRIWKRLVSGALALVLVVIGASAGALLYAERNIRAIISHRVDMLKLHPLNGATPARVADLRGRIVVLNFWATWCPPCRAEMPDLNRLADRYTNDVSVLTITDESSDQVRLYEQKIIALHTIVATFESDQPHGKLEMSAYQGRPTTVILDRDGRVREIFIGKQTYERLERAVERLYRRT